MKPRSKPELGLFAREPTEKPRVRPASAGTLRKWNSSINLSDMRAEEAWQERKLRGSAAAARRKAELLGEVDLVPPRAFGFVGRGYSWNGYDKLDRDHRLRTARQGRSM